MERMEHVKRPVVDRVRLQALGSRAPPIEGGTICITAFFLIFSSRKQSKDELTVSPFLSPQLCPQDILQVLHTSISQLDYKVGTSTAVIYLKDFRRLQLEFSSAEDCKDVVDALEVLSKPGLSLWESKEMMH